MITPQNAIESLTSLNKSIQQNATCYNRISECAKAYQGRQIRFRHYEGNVLVDVPLSCQWLWSAFADAVQRTVDKKPITQESLSELAHRVEGIAANARVLINYLSDSFMSEQPLNSIIGDLDSLLRMIDLLLADLRQK